MLTKLFNWIAEKNTHQDVKIDKNVSRETFENDYIDLNIKTAEQLKFEQMRNTQANIIKNQMIHSKDVCINNNQNTQTFDSNTVYSGAQYPYNYDNSLMDNALISNNLFQGFAFLAQFSQTPLVNNALNAYAKDIMRNGFTIESTSKDKDYTELFAKLKIEYNKFGCDKIIEEIVVKTLSLGGAMLYQKIKNDDDKLEKELLISSDTISVGSLEYFKVIEPTWCWNLGFNADRPLEQDFYKPTLYNAMGKTIHISRMYKLVFWDVPDLIKPIYYFYGLSLTQKMLQSYRNFETIQTEIPSLVKRLNFGILKLPLSEFANNSVKVINKIKSFLYNMTNYSMFVVNKDNEEYEQVTRNIAGLDEILYRYTELTSVSNQIPVTKFLGTSPKGLSSNDENGLINWHDLINGLRTTKCSSLVLNIYKLLALNIGVELPLDIHVKWGALEDANVLDQAKASELLSKEYERYLINNVIQKNDIQNNLAKDPNSGY
jgi:phage-related protein (TIGR01555 family)